MVKYGVNKLKSVNETAEKTYRDMALLISKCTPSNQPSYILLKAFFKLRNELNKPLPSDDLMDRLRLLEEDLEEHKSNCELSKMLG